MCTIHLLIQKEIIQLDTPAKNPVSFLVCNLTASVNQSTPQMRAQITGLLMRRISGQLLFPLQRQKAPRANPFQHGDAILQVID